MEIRGIWITTTGSQVFDSKQNIVKAMNLLAETGFNVVFPVVWNNGLTTYLSRVMRENFGTEINPRFQGRDPLAELIIEAKRVNIAVIPWFEYGFASSYKKNGGSIIAKKPEWAARDSAGNLLIKNGFEWLNAFDNEVQNFLLSLFLEVVKNYEVAGIQGDDRFPAFPSEGGYDSKTVERYKQEFNQLPPENVKEPKWLQWRADILTNFLTRVYREIINVNPDLIISLAPSAYPWSHENYLQDSKTWVEQGLVDLIHPQLYYREFELYKRDIDRVVANQFTKEQLPQLIPGVLLKQNTYIITPQHLVQALKYNRSVGIKGEVLFFYEALIEDNNALAKVLQSEVYSQSPGNFDQKEIKKFSFTHRRINSNFKYINPSQETVLKAQFDWVEQFSEGMAAVKMGYKSSYIDKTGKLISRLRFDTAAPFSEGLALVKINNKYGYIDKNAKLVIPLQFDDAVSFSSGMAAIKIANKWGYIEQTGKIIISAQFDEAKSLSEDLAAVKIDNKWGYINQTSQTRIDFQFDEAGRFSESLAAVKILNKSGYIDKFGNFIIEPKFDEADIFSQGVASVKIDNKWGYINQFGEFIIQPIFDFAKPFYQSMALVNIGGEFKRYEEQGKAYFTGGKWGYIRKP
ncbi:WG repeat-containing protein [Nostoc sp. FACHB-152]|uniref:WG repeat-containing protein n=1 Tax=unclassified Nostoc TaxID=2593658 RepID=UPI001688508A|nr:MULTISPECIES: WG repeat-containing protein [unclassified Nostoc]MBD2448863.1 WG repeat-containing protein [Nostoc sp. FACHB-152]